MLDSLRISKSLPGVFLSLIIGIFLISMKLFGFTDWSWGLVLLPWLPLIILWAILNSVALFLEFLADRIDKKAGNV